MKMEIAGADWGRFENHLTNLANFNFTGLHKEIGEYIVDSIKERFRTGVAPDGTAWKPSIRAKAESGKTLMKTRILYNSFTYRASSDKVEVGTNVKYARVHQGLDDSGQEVDEIVIKAKTGKGLRFRIAGSWVNKKEVKIPARRFMGFNDDDAGEITQIANDRIGECLQ
jgi:phage gpG-like protein